MARLESLGDEKTRQMNLRHGAGENQFGIKLGDLRAIAKDLKIDHELGRQLWATGNIEAMQLATLIMKPKLIPADELDQMVRSVPYSRVMDWLGSYIVKSHPDKEALRQKWMQSDDPMSARIGWSLTSERIAKAPEGLDLDAILGRIEREMGHADELVQWTMNYALAEAGINHPRLRERAVAIGEKLGVYRDYPVSKGCTSPFAPIWISGMVKRQA